MSIRPDRILVVDGSAQDARIHATTLRTKGFDAVIASDLEEARRSIKEQVPDLMLLARTVGDQDGYEFCADLKRDPRLISVPVVFITDRRDPQEIERCYDVGAVDYIVKPCHLCEFISRVETPIRVNRLLQEVEQLRDAAIDANPLTHLPGNNSIAATIQEAINEKWDVAVIHTDLDNFKAYNDAYGFNDGDEVLLFNAQTLQTVLQVVCSGEGFLGHVGGDDFVLVVPTRYLAEVGREIVERFDRGAPAFYREEDQARGYITAKDRQGRMVRYPIVSISMGAVPLQRRPFTRNVEVAEVCAEVKHKAKNINGSNMFVDRRVRALGPGRSDAASENDTVIVPASGTPEIQKIP